MNIAYTNKHYRRFLRRYIKNTSDFAKAHHYNHRNMRRWLYGPSFPRPPMIALLNKQISKYYKINKNDVILACNAALEADMQEHIMTD